MKKYLIILLFMCGHSLIAQDVDFSTVWTDSVAVPVDVRIGDFNRDGSSEFIIVAQLPDSGTVVLAKKPETPLPDTILYSAEGINHLTFDDVNGDNHEDLVYFSMKEKALTVQYSADSLEFLTPYDSISYIEIKRYTGGLPVIITSGWRNSTIMNLVYVRNEGVWKEEVLTGSDIPLAETTVLPDSTASMAIYGRHGTDVHKYTAFTSDTVLHDIHHLDRTFIDAHGLFINGPDSSGNELNAVAEPGKFMNLSAFITAAVTETVIADFTNDGITDILYTDLSGALALLTSVGIEDSLAGHPLSMRLSHLTYGDIDGDGDLDFAGISPDSAVVVYGENLVPVKNFGPVPVNRHVAFSFNDFAIIAWDSAIDDHTASERITYDLAVGTANFTTDVLPSTFRLDSATRMGWEWGNSGHSNIMQVNELDGGTYWYAIQSVDNARIALTSLLDCPYPVKPDEFCEGLPLACGSFTVCSEFAYTPMPACNDLVRINELLESGWYSSREGFLGFSQSLELIAMDGDTIYSVPVGSFSCDNQKAYVFSNTIISDTTEVRACPGQLTKLTVPNSPDSVRWLINDETVALGSRIFHVFDSAAQVTAISSFGNCKKTDVFNVAVEQPVIEILPDSATILLGETLYLNATGADTYVWEPSEPILENFGNQVMVAPEETTRFTATGTDAFGCVASDSALVNVIRQAFIPNLFTPNQDNNNDVLLIYGLGQTRSFEFIVFNRNGSVVFQSEDASDMQSIGWDGTANGKKLPDGVYYWKVAGAFDSGKQILLNGAKEGVVHLLR